MQPTAVFYIKLEANSLFIQSQDGQSWEPLLAESAMRFFVQGQEEYQFTFIKDSAGMVTGFTLVYRGIEMPLAKKIE